MTAVIDDRALDILFREARSHSKWHSKPVPKSLLQDIWNLTRMGPTSANCSPARIVFVVSEAAREKLRPCLMAANVEKVMTAPVTAIIGEDLAFYDRLPELFPEADARSWFAGRPAVIEETAFRNATLQGAYFMLAARAYGLDCGPMSGFDKAKADAAFFGGTSIRSNFLCSLGYGDGSDLSPRTPRLAFDEACQIL